MNFDEYIKQGFAFIEKKEYGQALEKLEAALKIQPDNADIRQMIEMTKMQINNSSSRMQAAANEAIERVKIFETFWGRKDYDNAIAEYTQALNLNPAATVRKIFLGEVINSPAQEILADAYYIRGLKFDSKGEDARAIEAYNEAIKYNSEFPLAIKKRAFASSRIHDYDQAIEDFKNMIQFEPDDPKWKENLANAYKNRGIA